MRDGSLRVRPATEMGALVVGASTLRANLTVPSPAGASSVSLPQLVPQQARVRLSLRASGPSLPASLGLRLLNRARAGSGEVDEPAPAPARSAEHEETPQLLLTFALTESSACASLDVRHGCAPLRAPSPRTAGAGGTWMWNASFDLWLDNGLYEAYLDDGVAILSAFYPRLFGATGLSGSVFASGNATGRFSIEWSAVASASFHNSTHMS